ncbi:ATP-dependent RNA helicase [Aliidiomarina shirensis]|uniref:DEAD-box ATP-dependent RNA helicase RhpA n=1 Tax=Aliidiomarina shirensis TaxID=1048642 RepID=A0A432WTE6_9GAMM|nr:DEAD/DEAH box helicase [Aliidiomarina shirensis]RUO37017.1 ATP-dependent RNA helicase [Aliidiomarina shirensis]
MSEFNTFSALELPEPILRAISELGFDTPTPIQQQAIPGLLAKKNVLGEAQTGTGKTAAFGLPALANIDTRVRGAQLLVVAPTRELAIQVAESIEAMGKYMKGLNVATIYGGSSYGPQIKSLRGGAQIVVGTPGRLMDHLRKGSLDLSALKMAVLDEADEMLNMGFVEDIEWIMEQVPDTAQRALFSATMPPQIRKIANKFLTDPVHVKIESTQATKANIAQKAWKVQGMTKDAALERLLESIDYQLVLVFVRTRNDTLTVSAGLREQGFKAAGLNGDMSQEQRESTVSQLKSGKIRILVGTDVVARGLDVPGVTHVINYDLPQDAESYVHRIGRTGRAGRSGESISFARPREMHLLKRYERATNGTIEMINVPQGRELSKLRIEQAQAKILARAQEPAMKAMASLVEQMTAATEMSVEEMAAALLYEYQLTRPLIVKDEPKPKFDRKERSVGADRGRNDRSDRGDRNARGKRPERAGERSDRGGAERRERKPRRDANIEFDTYRLSVGTEHGARPGDVVGAIANEADMDSRYIGEIQLFATHTTVQLPKGMPPAILQKLKKARIRQQPMAISPVHGKVIS